MTAPIRVRTRCAVALAAVAAAASVVLASAAVPAASAQTVADVEVRDRLIFDQEALLNAYRCLFAVDVEIVPGGCVGGSPAQPAPGPPSFTDTPIAVDIAVRDELAAEQEALLDTYRCLFGVDVEIVPGGCVGGAPAGPGAGGDQSQAAVSADIAIAGGTWHSCAISETLGDEARNVVCWGSPTGGKSDPPEGRFTALAASQSHTCGIREDRTVDCWGNNDYGQADAPAGRFTAVAASIGHPVDGQFFVAHSCAVRDNGAVICWGWNEHGQADAPAGRFTAVAAGAWHSCGIRADRTIACWGNNEYGQADAPAGRFTAIAAGRWHSCAVGADGTVDCWGNNANGIADAPAGRFTAIAAGAWHSCGIRADRTIACWGWDEDGQADPPDGQFTAVAAGASHACAIRTDNTIVCWGNNNSGQSFAPIGLVPIQAVYAVPSDLDAVADREQAIADVVSAVQKWFRSQTGGRHPLFKRDGDRISVVAVNLPYTEEELLDVGSGRFFDYLYEQLGSPRGAPLLVYQEGELPGGGCGFATTFAVIIPIDNCSRAPEVGAEWPYGSTYIAAHELTHLLGAASTCAPNHSGGNHVDDDNRDVLYLGPNADLFNMMLDVGHDDYYMHGRDDCHDIARNPLLAAE